MHQREEIGAWLRLTKTKGIGNTAARKLLSTFGLPQEIFKQSQSALKTIISSAQAQALKELPENFEEELEKLENWLSQSSPENQRAYITLADKNYPPALYQIQDPPIALYMMGQIEEIQKNGWTNNALAMVGSRSPSPQGEQNAHQFARSFAAQGFTIISGLARGIDGAAHQGAIFAAQKNKTNQITTIAIIGTGIDRVYPSAHKQLAHDITKNGLIISEYPLGTPPIATNFPKRNRIIAGLSAGTLVVEAALKSGSLITARIANEMGKEVFAIPGSIHNIQSKGAHWLIKQGAKLVETAEDVIEELSSVIQTNIQTNPIPRKETPKNTDGKTNQEPEQEEGQEFSGENEIEKNILKALGSDPASLDTLQNRTGYDTATLQANLLTLELDGQIARMAGNVYQRIGFA